MKRIVKGAKTVLVFVLSLILVVCSYPNLSLASSQSLDWVGNMYPGGNSESSITTEDGFDIDIQVYKPGVTEKLGKGSDISCTLYWSEVDLFGEAWNNPQETPMEYIGDLGDRDEYHIRISPKLGLYEFTVKCTDNISKITAWQSSGNGRLIVSNIPTEPVDRRAFWLEKGTLAWNNFQAYSYELHYNVDGSLIVPINSGLGIPLTPKGKITSNRYPKFPNIYGYQTLEIPEESLSSIPEILKSEMAIAAYNEKGQLIDITGVQIQGVLDDLYSYSGELGVIYQEGIPTIKVWAPTAQSITLHRFGDANPSTNATTTPMNYDPQTGVWSITGNTTWDRQYYLLEVEVYMPVTGEIEHNIVTDPYSVNLSENSRRSQIVDIYNDANIKPEGWDTLVKPDLDAPEDMAIYETHVRDFSRDDFTVAREHRGTFKAFTYDGQKDRPALSNGMKHLMNLSRAGLTHIHLLPAFDVSSIDENAVNRNEADYSTLASFRPNSVEQQSIIGSIRKNDAFNWGYDPFHYGVPEGSYATKQNDTTRIMEFREMVQALSDNGLRVVMDVVYNHTAANGLYTESVLDKVVPNYYYRYTNEGYQYNSSCCPDTATEFDMMSKLVVDTLVRWAKAYKVDGFRFDLMNLQTVENIIAVRDALHSLTLEKDGVDGEKIYIYGEGWDFGSAKEKGLRYANQYNAAGTGVGTFNDKIRDATHGGSSGNPNQSRQQGYINGLAYDWNGYFYSNRFKSDLNYSMDRLRVGLAGSLQDFEIIDQNNNLISGLFFNGTGYTKDPQESINYISKHDNETLYDLNVFKMPLGNNNMARTNMEQRVRAQNLGMSIVGLSQGIPFFQMGCDLLRSKSLDRNSYDSGDWFNRVDFSYNKNNFGVGLPPAWDNQERWGIMSPLLDNQALYPRPDDIVDSATHLQDILKIRKSSKLFRLETAEDVHDRIKFYNTGSAQKDAMIVMSIDDTFGEDLDPNYDRVVVLFNANKLHGNYTIDELKGSPLELHPVQAKSRDPLVKTASFNSFTGEFTIPPRTAAVFVAPQTTD